MEPTPRLIRSPRDAELAACEWMRFWGYADAHLTGSGPDGGADVVAGGAVAQVKAEVAPTGRPVVQATYGVAAAERKEALVFSLGGFTQEAIDWASRTGIACFQFDLQGVPRPINAAAYELLRRGGSLNPGHYLQKGDRVKPEILASTLYEYLVMRQSAGVGGVARNPQLPTDPHVWFVELEGEDLHATIHPLVLDRGWLRRRRRDLPPPWERHDAVEGLRRHIAATDPGMLSQPSINQRILETIEKNLEYDTLYYRMSRNEGSVETSVHQIVRDIDAGVRALGARLSETTLDPWPTSDEMLAQHAYEFKHSRPRAD